VGLLSGFFVLFALGTWMLIGAVWAGAIWRLRQKTSVLGVLLLMLCLLICPLVGHGLLGPRLVLGPRLEFSGLLMALFADSLVISGVAADYVSVRL